MKDSESYQIRRRDLPRRNTGDETDYRYTRTRAHVPKNKKPRKTEKQKQLKEQIDATLGD